MLGVGAEKSAQAMHSTTDLEAFGGWVGQALCCSYASGHLYNFMCRAYTMQHCILHSHAAAGVP